MGDSPNQIFLKDSQVALLAKSAMGSSKQALEDRVQLIELAQQGNNEAKQALVQLALVLPPKEEAKKKTTFRKPRRLTKDPKYSENPKLSYEASKVKNLRGRSLNIKEVLSQGGIAGTRKQPQYVTDAIQFKLQKGRQRPAPTMLGVKPVSPNPPTEKQLAREAARAQAIEDAG